MIRITSVKVQNFCAITTPIKVSLDACKITTISGENGASKSSLIIDSIYYAFFGKSFRGTIMSNLINKKVKKNLVVEMEFSVDGVNYKIVRGQKPAIFEIYVNGDLKTQSAATKDYQKWLQNYVLRMNEKTFRQICVIGSTSYVPFMLLKTEARRAVVDEVLSVDIYTAMLKLAKEEQSLAKKHYMDLENEKRQIEIKLSMQKKNDDTIIQRINEDIINKQNDIDNLNSQKNILIEEANTIKSEYNEEETRNAQNEINNITSQIQKINTNKAKASVRYQEYNKTRTFFANNTTCPTCTQEIDKEFVENKIADLDTHMESGRNLIKKLENAINQGTQRINELNNIIGKNHEVIHRYDMKSNEIRNVDSVIRMRYNDIENNKRQIVALQSKKSEDLTQYEEELKVVNTNIEECMIKNSNIDILVNLLKDNGIKQYVVSTFIPALNELIQKYLEIVNFPINFAFNETFDATITDINGNTFEYNNFSEGERLRIDTSIMFAFRELTKMNSNSMINVLVMDEFDRGIADDSALAAIYDILQQESNDENIFIISHNIDYFTSLADRNLFVKKENGEVTVSDK